MKKSIDTDVLIVGAGPTGLTVAVELMRRGISCRIIDSLSEPSEKSRALAIHARTLELFEKMDLIDDFLAVGWKSHAFSVYEKTEHVARLSFSEIDSPFPYVLCLPQTQTEKLLAKKLSTSGGAIEWDTTLLALEQEDEKVTVTAKQSKSKKSSQNPESSNGSAEQEVQISCRWLVACDGSHSRVRNLLDLNFRGVPYWEQYVLADVTYDTTLDPRDHYVFCGREGVAGFHPFSETEARIFADLGRIRRPRHATDRLPADRIEFSEPSLEEFQAILDSRGPKTVKLKQMNWLSMHTIHRRQVGSYRHGRVLIAGDAAHLHSPTSGQGMNLGIQDAYNLAWKLALVLKRLAGNKLLDSYNSERKLTCKQISAMSDFFSRINNVRSPILQALRKAVIPVITEQEGVRKLYRNAVAELSFNYELSPVVDEVIHETWQGAPRAGARAPDALLKNKNTAASIRLFDLLRSNKFQLLLFAGIQKADIKDSFNNICQYVSSQHSQLIDCNVLGSRRDFLEHFPDHIVKLHDEGASAHKKYGANHPCLFLIRPDGYVAFRAAPPTFTDLHIYLQSLLS